MFILFQGELNSVGGTSNILAITKDEDKIKSILEAAINKANKLGDKKILGFELYDPIFNKSKTYTRNKERLFDINLVVEIFNVVKNHHVSYPIL